MRYSWRKIFIVFATIGALALRSRLLEHFRVLVTVLQKHFGHSVFNKVQQRQQMAIIWHRPHLKMCLTLCMLDTFSCLCCRLLIFFSKLTFSKKSLRTLSGCQMVWIQIRTNILSVLMWVQTVCKGYQQMSSVATSIEWTKKTLFSRLTVLVENEISVCTKYRLFKQNLAFKIYYIICLSENCFQWVKP